MKKNLRSILALSCISLTLMTSCDQRKDTKDVAEDHNEAKFEGAKEKDADFVVEAAAINMEELQLTELASSRASGKDVKILADMMHADHQKSLDELKALALKKNITIPTSLSSDGQDNYNKLSEKTGVEFDKKFCTMMTDGHKDAIKKFEDASSEVEDPDIRDWANKTLPVLRGHLDRAMGCAEVK